MGLMAKKEAAMVDWLPYATRVLAGNGTGSFDYEVNPSWKLLLHTTEGFTISSAEGAYRNGNYWPHVTVGPGSGETIDTHQHYPFSSRATTLADRAGGIRTNRDYVLQVEIVGFCDPKYSHHWLYIHNWPAWYRKGVAKVVRDMLAARPIPRRRAGEWRNYPESAWKVSPIRMSTSEFDKFSGILGHQHAPENTHGDPGDLRKFVDDYLLSDPEPEPKPEPPKEWDELATKEEFAEVAEAAARKAVREELAAALSGKSNVGDAAWSHAREHAGLKIRWQMGRWMLEIYEEVLKVKKAVAALAAKVDGGAE